MKHVAPWSARAVAVLAAALVAACGGTPPAPDWQMNARDSMGRSLQAYLSGGDRVAASEFARARGELMRTGRADLLARAELMRCAGHVASLVFGPCAGFEALRADAAPPERAYADYLAGRLPPADTSLLPAWHRSVATGGNTLPADSDPLARLVAAAVLLQSGRASPAVVAQAVETASAQGWRRPLLAWLGVQARLAEQGGDAAQVARIQRRIALVLGPQAPAAAPAADDGQQRP
jgi:hypothetical protein